MASSPVLNQGLGPICKVSTAFTVLIRISIQVSEQPPEARLCLEQPSSLAHIPMCNPIPKA